MVHLCTSRLRLGLAVRSEVAVLLVLRRTVSPAILFEDEILLLLRLTVGRTRGTAMYVTASTWAWACQQTCGYVGTSMYCVSWLGLYYFEYIRVP